MDIEAVLKYLLDIIRYNASEMRETMAQFGTLDFQGPMCHYIIAIAEGSVAHKWIELDDQ